MRTLKTLIAAAALLILAACGGNNSNTFPEAVITGVTPAEVTAGAEITVSGRNYYAVTGAGVTRIEACGVTVYGSLVEPLTRTILLPPGSTITAEVGSTITGTLPEEGFTAGLSDVRVTRPDGSSAVLENAVTCAIPSEEPELPVAPGITSFTGPETTLAGEAVTFAWVINNPDESDLTCTLHPGAGFDTITLEDCSGEYGVTYTEPGEYQITLTVSDEHDQTDTATITVNATVNAPVIDMWDVELAYNDPNGEIITAEFFLQGRNLTSEPVTCSIDFGDNTEPLELGADCVDETQHTISYSDYGIGAYDATLTITDTHGNQVNKTIEVNVTNPDAPRALISSNNIANGGMPEVYFHLGLLADPGLDSSLLACTLRPGDGNEVDEPTCDPTTYSYLIYTYDNPGRYTASFTVTDPYNESVTAEHAIAIRPSPPFISWFTGPEATVVSEVATLTWEIHNWENSILTCTLDPGGELETITLEDCDAGEHDVTYEDAGEYTATLTVTDDYGGTTSATTTVLAIDSSAPTGTLTGPSSADANESVTFEWGITYGGLDELTCTFNAGDGTATVELDCAVGSITHSYGFADDYTVTLTVKDAFGREVDFTTSIEVAESSALYLTINTNLPSGAKPDIIVFRVDPDFHEELTGAGTVTLPGPGTYAIQGFSDSDHQVEVPYNGGVQSYYLDWEGVTTSVTVEAATDKTVNLNFNIPTKELQAETRDLPDSYDITDVNAILQRLNEPNGDSWQTIGPITTTGQFDVAPGLYRVLVDDVTHEVCYGVVCYTEEYVALEAHPFDISSGAGWDTVYRYYELQTGSITTSAEGLPDGVTAGFDLQLVPDSTFVLPPWDELNPGWYFMSPANVTSSIPFDSFGVPAGETQYAPADGLIDVYYRADGQPVHLSSGETENAHAQYRLADALINVTILPPWESGLQVLGNISIRAIPNGEWHTFTTMEQHEFYTPPGVYEIKVEDVPADLQAGHNGYRALATPFNPYFAVDSYGGGVGYEVGFMYWYEPIPAP